MLLLKVYRASVSPAFGEADRYRSFSGGVPNSGLALTLFHPAEFITNITDHRYGNNMNDKPSAVKKQKALGQDH